MERISLEQYVEKGGDNKYLRIKVIPNSAKTEISKWDGENLKIKIKASPEKGKANSELVKFFKKEYKKDIKIVKGANSRNKLIYFK